MHPFTHRACTVWLAGALAIVCGCATTPHDPPLTPARIEVPLARGTVSGVAIEVLIDDRASVGMERTPYWLFFAAGAAALPLSVLNPAYALGLLYPVLGPPLNAAFEAKRDTLIRVVAAEPLPAAVFAAFRTQLPATRIAPQTQIRLAIGGYGLAPRSGTPANAMFPPAEELCLTAQAHLTVARPGRPDVTAPVRVELTSTSADAPPPTCASIARFAAADGAYLRQAIRELAEILAALSIARLEAAP